MKNAQGEIWDNYFFFTRFGFIFRAPTEFVRTKWTNEVVMNVNMIDYLVVYEMKHHYELQYIIRFLCFHGRLCIHYGEYFEFVKLLKLGLTAILPCPCPCAIDSSLTAAFLCLWIIFAKKKKMPLCQKQTIQSTIHLNV